MILRSTRTPISHVEFQLYEVSNKSKIALESILSALPNFDVLKAKNNVFYIQDLFEKAAKIKIEEFIIKKSLQNLILKRLENPKPVNFMLYQASENGNVYQDLLKTFYTADHSNSTFWIAVEDKMSRFVENRKFAGIDFFKTNPFRKGYCIWLESGF
ncbi:hypothetical protein L596_022789 [Steinernema carpocapsae]|uniref:Uncharacterized protein n=1 Tax=Steinernema carpocapsae TaxID=34508 RepID=A0A4V6A0B9_STECR|nr:hypothetical protein L596_022789 [Steinernema carpocapsae]